MSLALGLHNGHHASCAIVRDGVLVAAMQLERVSRIKADAKEALSNAMPVAACLKAASATLADIDIIVSSFQAASPGGVGLHRPLVESGFSLFDPFDARHFVASHHLAHALSSFGTSGFTDAAVLVCDLGGSTTIDGMDFLVPFSTFKNDLCCLPSSPNVRTECLSIYDVDSNSIQLKKREFCVPHNAPDVFVSSAASLYDNVSRAIFGRENAHGQLMALASLNNGNSNHTTLKDIVQERDDGQIIFRNDWQQLVETGQDDLTYVGLANAAQMALQHALVAYVAQARRITQSQNLTCAGGTFLNIIVNTQILESKLFSRFYVPSSPHDAGVAVGCAYAGLRRLGGGNLRVEADDRLGPLYRAEDIDRTLSHAGYDRRDVDQACPRRVAELLNDGVVVARFAGRSEFGPRALGGRSLLASPLLATSKTRLNEIKGRQPWRPVAPVIPEEQISDFFEGPRRSRYMNFVHRVPKRLQNVLPALAHPDGSTRVQTLREADDPFLYQVLGCFKELTGFPILVNTSLNGPGEPIVETPSEALEFFIATLDVGCLLLDDQLLRERKYPHWSETHLASDVLISFIPVHGRNRVLMIRGGASMEISQDAFDYMRNLVADEVRRSKTIPNPEVELELKDAARLRFLVPRGV
jgi:carbamoyltransferase